MRSGESAAAAGVASILARKGEMGLPDLNIGPLGEFLAWAGTVRMDRAAMEVICDQAIFILDQFYAHLTFKRARYGIDPVQRLRLLRTRIPGFEHDLEFHSEVLKVFTELRDAHTLYGLPPPYRGALAFLPFVMKHYTDEGGALRFIVTQTLSGFSHPQFVPGAEVVSWNGTPIARAMERVASIVPAGNEASKFTRALSRMSSRNMTFALPPAEEFVFVEFMGPDSSQREVLMLPWYVATGFPEGTFRAPATATCQPVAERAGARPALWDESQWVEQQVLQAQEERGQMARQGLGEAPVFASLDAVPESLREPDVAFLHSRLPNIFEFQHPSGLILRRSITPDELCLDGKRFGYIRIKSFEASPDQIFEEFKRILEAMNEFGPEGLVLDVRANPGGSIKGAERLLQLLTPNPITPASFHFANTPTIQKILSEIAALTSEDPEKSLRIRALQAEFRPWIADAALALAEGLAITDGCPLTSARSANNTGQVYHGPVVLVIDAVSYSATDIFAAGFQDHGIGEIIGVDENTGGGGASRWWHQDDLFERLAVLPRMPLEPLPGGATIAFASLRSSRTGRKAGQALEDVGVKRTIAYQLTKKDLMDWGSDLVKFACRHLASRTCYGLTITGATLSETSILLTVKSKNIDRLVVYVKGIPQYAASASLHVLEVPLDGLEPREVEAIEVRGFARKREGADLELVAAVRVRVSAGSRGSAP